MQQAGSTAQFCRDPVDRWIATATAMVWFVSPTLCGVSAWGRASAADAKVNVALFGSVAQARPPADLVLDARGMEAADMDALAVLLSWTRQQIPLLRTKVRRRVGLIPLGAHGMVLAGLSPVLGWMDAVSIAPDLPTALGQLDAPDPASVAVEIDEILRSLRAAPTAAELRALLTAHDGNLSLDAAARLLRISPRSLQRALADEDSSFRAEEQQVRFAAATRLLATNDDKISAIARRLGLGERALANLTRQRTGLGPHEYRQRLRARRDAGDD